MEPIAERKLHFAPLERQLIVIQRLLRQGEYRNVTELMHRALDYYFAARGRPSLMQQAQQLADDLAHGSAGKDNVGRLQLDSMSDSEKW